MTTASEDYVLRASASLARFAGSKKQQDLEALLQHFVQLCAFAMEKESDCFKISEANKHLQRFRAESERELSELKAELEDVKKEALAKADEDVPF